MAIAAVFAGSLASFTGVQSTVREVQDRTAPAVLEVAAARSALAQADSEAMTSFHTGQAQLIGPGQQYQIQLAISSQNLARVAEHNSAGEAGSRTLQLVEGLLAAYGGWIEEADAHFRTGGSTLLGVTDLWYASRLMHEPSSGILAQLDTLAELERSALAETLSTDWMNSAWVLTWLVPIVVLLALLVLAQVFEERKFRRTVNPTLAVATLLSLALVWPVSTTLVSRANVEAARQTLTRVVDQQNAQTGRVATGGQQTLALLLRSQCADVEQDGCGVTASAFIARFDPAQSGSATSSVLGDLAGTKQISDELASAGESGFLAYLISVGAIAVTVLILFGFRRGIDEYRYRAT